MWDIVVGILIVILASLALYRLGSEARRRAPAVAVLLALFTTTSVVWFAVAVRGTLGVARVLPLSNAIVLGNLVPLGAALLAGLIGGDRSAPRWRRRLLALVLLALAWQTNSFRLSGAMPAAIDRWSVDRVCLQTTPYSCSASCAVMLLEHRGIRSDEIEMIRLCLTDTRGTTPLGLYRGLRIKTRGTPWQVEIVDGGIEPLRREADGPVLIFVRMEDMYGGVGVWPDWRGRRPQHSVVVYGFSEDGCVLVGDPAMGLCRRSCGWLEERWTGQGLRLVGRETEPKQLPRNKSTASERHLDARALTIARPSSRSGGGPAGEPPRR